MTENPIIERISHALLPTEQGNFKVYAYRSLADGVEHLALVAGEVTDSPVSVLVRLHSECLTGDVFLSRRCDCRAQLQLAMDMIGEEGLGVCIYLRGHEGRAIGLAHKIRCYALQDAGLDTVEANLELGLPADARDYQVGVHILKDLGVKKIRLLTNNPQKYEKLQNSDFESVERIALNSPSTQLNQRYLLTKKLKMGHWLEL